MPKGDTIRVTLLISGSILIIIGVILMGWMWANLNNHDVIEVNLADGVTYPVLFEDLSLVPGDERSYDISLRSTSAKNCDLTLDFVELEDKTLKNYLRVKVTVGNDKICDALLAEVLAGDAFVLPVDFTGNKNTKLTVTYYLPEAIGNEAKNAGAVFELQITANNR